MTAAERDVRQEVRRLALPAILHSFLQTLVFVVDRAMLGRLGETPLAAMQIAGPLEWSVFSVLLAFEVGVVARVGFYVGAARRAQANAATAAGVSLAFLFGVLVMSLSPLVLASLHFVAPRASAATLAQAGDYLGVTLLASPIVFFATAAIAALQASGDTKTPLVIAAFANVVHIGLNRLFILGGLGIPAMGTRGCAYSTAITFTLEAALLGVALMRPAREVSLRAAGLFSRVELTAKAKEILAVAWPSVLERMLYHCGFVGFVMMIGRLGDRVMAGNQVLISIESICFLSADGFGIAAAALVAQKLGAGSPAGAQAAARVAARDAAVLLTFYGVVAYVFRDVIVGVLVDAPDVRAVSTSAMIVLMVAQPFMAVSIVLAQSLRGAGRTREALAATSVSALFVRLAATYVFAFGLDGGLRGVWWGSTADWVVRAAILTVIWTTTAHRTARTERAAT